VVPHPALGVARAAVADDDIPDRARLRSIGRKVRKRLAANEAARPIAADRADMWVVPDFLDRLDAGRLMAMVDATARPSVAYGTAYESGHRTSYTGDLDSADPFVLALERRIDRLLGIDGGHGEMIQGQRYLAGQQFKPHFDWFAPGTAAWDKAWHAGGQRSFTAMIYLNAVAEGGETDFPRLDLAVAPRAGMLLAWNNMDESGMPNPLTLHAGNPVGRGSKYVITRWYRCRPCGL